jgi:hypothetical protein
VRAYELAPADWHRLRGMDLEQAVPHLDPSTTRIAVVESEQGEILGCWALVWLPHVEGVWIRPDHQKKTSVARKLWRLMHGFVREAQRSTVITGAQRDDVAALLTKRATPLPPCYLLPMGGV